jgi:hypothetical protein
VVSLREGHGPHLMSKIIDSFRAKLVPSCRRRRSRATHADAAFLNGNPQPAIVIAPGGGERMFGGPSVQPLIER